jgi:ankyrin repeat protein
VGCGPPKDICETAKQGDIRAVRLFIADGADVNARDANGLTPLHGAAFLGEKEIVELLIAKGPDVNAKTNGGLTPLVLAEEEKQTETADLLRKHGGKTGEELN